MTVHRKRMEDTKDVAVLYILLQNAQEKSQQQQKSTSCFVFRLLILKGRLFNASYLLILQSNYNMLVFFTSFIYLHTSVLNPDCV